MQVWPECMMLVSSAKDDYNERNLGSSFAIAVPTTTYARPKLLNIMDRLGERLFYYDTDSVSFVEKPGEREALSGNILEDWDDQLEPGESISYDLCRAGQSLQLRNQHRTGRDESPGDDAKRIHRKHPSAGWGQQCATRTGKKWNFNQLRRLLDGSVTVLQVIYPEFLQTNRKIQQIGTVQLA